MISITNVRAHARFMDGNHRNMKAILNCIKRVTRKKIGNKRQIQRISIKNAKILNVVLGWNKTDLKLLMKLTVWIGC